MQSLRQIANPIQNKPPEFHPISKSSRDFDRMSYEILMSERQGQLYPRLLSQPKAVMACEELGNDSTLLTVKSANVTQFLTQWLFKELKLSSTVWLNLVRLNKTSTFIWPDGERLNAPSTLNGTSSSYANFHHCEPNGLSFSDWGVPHNPNENCVEMLSDYYTYPRNCNVEAKGGQWNDKGCDVENIVVCQRKII